MPSDFIACARSGSTAHALDFALYAVAFLLLVIALVRLAAQARARRLWRVRRRHADHLYHRVG